MNHAQDPGISMRLLGTKTNVQTIPRFSLKPGAVASASLRILFGPSSPMG